MMQEDGIMLCSASAEGIVDRVIPLSEMGNMELREQTNVSSAGTGCSHAIMY